MVLMAIFPFKGMPLVARAGLQSQVHIGLSLHAPGLRCVRFFLSGRRGLFHRWCSRDSLLLQLTLTSMLFLRKWISRCPRARSV